MSTKTFSYRNSKDRQLGIYLAGRVFYDHGSTVEPIEGVIKISDNHLLADRAVYLEVACDYTYEDEDYEVHKKVFFERTVILHPNPLEKFVANSAQRALVKKIGAPCFPFTLTIPSLTPASVVLKPGAYHEGRQIGVAWSIRSYMTSPASTAKQSHTSMPFRKVNYFPIHAPLKPVEFKGKKSFMFDSGNPLAMTVELEKDVFVHGEPIAVHVTIQNDSKKDVYAVKLSAKQICTVKYDSYTSKFKSQVSLLESTRQCPIKKQTRVSTTYSIMPKLMSQEHHHVAQEMKLNLADEAQLAATTRLNHSGADDLLGVIVSYYMNVHAVVNLGSDLIVKVPFHISYPPPDPPSSSSSSSREHKNKLKEKEAAAAASTSATTTTTDADPSAALVGTTAAAAAVVAQDKEECLIDLDNDHVPELPSFADRAPIASATPSTPFFPSDGNVFGALDAAPKSGVDAAIEMVRRANRLLLKAQSAASSHALPNLIEEPESDSTVTASNPGGELQMLATVSKQVGGTVNQLLLDVSHVRKNIDPNSVHTVTKSAESVAACLDALATATVTAAKSTKDTHAQLRLVQLVFDILEKSMLLLEAVKTRLADPNGATAAQDRDQLHNIAEYISQALPAVLNTLPGQCECKAAIDTISTTRLHLQHQSSATVSGAVSAPPLTLPTAADRLHNTARVLSNAFKLIGAACVGAGDTDQLAVGAANFRHALPAVVSAGQALGLTIADTTVRAHLIGQLDLVCTRAVVLLRAAMEIRRDTSGEKRTTLDQAATAMVNCMRTLLTGTQQLRMQYEELQKAQPDMESLRRVQHLQQVSQQQQQQQQKQQQQQTRRDSFDEFIAARAGFDEQSPVETGGPSTEQQLAEALGGVALGGTSDGTTGDASMSDAATELMNVYNRVALTRKALIDAKARPRRMSVMVNQPVLPGRATVLDSMLPIINAVSHLVQQSHERVKELRILGRAFHAANFYQKDRSWAEGLVAAAAALAKSTSALVHTGDDVSQGDEPVEALIKAANTVSNDAAHLVAASQVQEHVNSNSQTDVEVASRAVTQATFNLQQAAANVSARTLPAAQPTGGVSAEEFHKQQQILELEKDLETGQKTFFKQRRGSFWSDV